jgi:hypothetical protein
MPPELQQIRLQTSTFCIRNLLPPPPKQKLKDFFAELKEDQKLMVAELKMVCAERQNIIMNQFEPVKPFDCITSIRQQIDVLNSREQLDRLSDSVKKKYQSVFDPIPHLDDLPTDVYCHIKLKDASKTFATQSYTTPRKYKEAWTTLIQQHLDAGCIRPSNSAHASPAFLVPKSDHLVLPRWVNDY